MSPRVSQAGADAVASPLAPIPRRRGCITLSTIITPRRARIFQGAADRTAPIGPNWLCTGRCLSRQV
jgi:hypothetical protein